MLRRAVASGHVPHAYLFEGPDGVGKRAAAYGLALALTCAVEPGEGCGTCDSCRRIDAGLHPDVPVFAAETAQIVIEQAQAIVAMAATRPHEAPARVIIIDDADRLNVNAANCLLKTLEEPAPRHAHRAGDQRARPHPADDPLARAAHPLPRADRRGAGRAADRGARGRSAPRRRGGRAGRRLGRARAARRRRRGRRDLGFGLGAARGRRRRRAAAAAPTSARIFDAAAAVAGDKEIKLALPPILSLLGRLYRDAMVTAAGAPELALFREQAARAGDGRARRAWCARWPPWSRPTARSPPT